MAHMQIQVGLNVMTRTMRKKRKMILTEYQRDQMIPRNHIYDVLSEEGMEAETNPASPSKGRIARLPTT